MNIHKLLLSLATFTVLVTSSVTLLARDLPETVKTNDIKILNKQTADLYQVVDTIAAQASPHVVAIKSGDQVIAMGTVTQYGIITKLSEIAKNGVQPRIVDHMGLIHTLRLKSVNEDYDLALLENLGNLAPIKINNDPTPAVGSILIAPGAANQALSMGILSVSPRSLRETDRGFLGVVMNPDEEQQRGVLLMSVQEKTAAARAGLQAGDIVTKINDTKVENLFQMKNLLLKQQPGDTILMNFIRDGREVQNREVILGARKAQPQIKRSRMNIMKRMGGPVSKVSEGFPDVIQTDMQLKSNHCGSPVIDLNGNFIGITIARASRIKTYIVGANKLAGLFKK